LDKLLNLLDTKINGGYIAKNLALQPENIKYLNAIETALSKSNIGDISKNTLRDMIKDINSKINIFEGILKW
jgi:cation transport regulator ChaC